MVETTNDESEKSPIVETAATAAPGHLSRKASLPTTGNANAIFGKKKSWAEHLADEDVIQSSHVAMSAIVPPTGAPTAAKMTPLQPSRQPSPQAIYYPNGGAYPYYQHPPYVRSGGQLPLPSAVERQSYNMAQQSQVQPHGSVKFVNSTVEILQNQMKREEAPKKKRTRTTPDQLRILQRAFAADPMPNSSTRLQLAKRLGMNGRAVQVWFQNRRAKAKRQDSLPNSSGNLMLDYSPNGADLEQLEQDEGTEYSSSGSPNAELLRGLRPKQQRHSMGGAMMGKAPSTAAVAAAAGSRRASTTAASYGHHFMPPNFGLGGADEYDAMGAFLMANQLHPMPVNGTGEMDLLYGGGLLANDPATAAHFAISDLHPSLLMMGMDFQPHEGYYATAETIPMPDKQQQQFLFHAPLHDYDGPFLGYEQHGMRRSYSVPNNVHFDAVRSTSAVAAAAKGARVAEEGGTSTSSGSNSPMMDEEMEMRRQAARSRDDPLLLDDATSVGATAAAAAAAASATAHLPAGPVEDGGELDEINRLLASAIPDN